MSKSKLLKGFPDLVKIEILKIAFPLEFYEDELIISKSYETGYFFIISSGKVELIYENCEEVIGFNDQIYYEEKYIYYSF